MGMDNDPTQGPSHAFREVNVFFISTVMILMMVTFPLGTIFILTPSVVFKVSRATGIDVAFRPNQTINWSRVKINRA